MTPPLPLPGRPYPLGATWDGDGTNFAVFSRHAQAIDLCLVDDAGAETQVPLAERDAHVWHVRVPGIGPGQRYGYRASGPWDPAAGHRFNASKFLLDPYARAIDGVIETDDPSMSAADADGAPSPLDSRRATAAGVVVDTAFDWGDDRPPDHPWSETVVYEAHVRGISMRHPELPPEIRGTYAGLAHPAVIGHLTSLGVSAVELLPVHHAVDEPMLRRRGQHNYWGYSSVGYFAPAARYASTGTRGGQVTEFRTMVRELHRAGLEVILDVVYNHTGEGGPDGPMIGFRGLDDTTYYRSRPETPGDYVDVTGTGNTVDTGHPAVIRLVMDSLRYWVTEMHVDGFRFDLATALARDPWDFTPTAALLTAIGQDPVLSRVKLIAEPWDLGMGGFQVGGFPAPWSEWNGPYRDGMRDFWRGRSTVGEFARRLAGSSDIYDDGARRPSASVNFITAHDGFTLHDLVSYEHKHNEANGEDNRDGTDDNRSWNCGAEGPSHDPAIRDRRWRQMRNLMATLLLSQGVPMICGGDELGRTQHGNNNAYCQDSVLSWHDWHLTDETRVFLRFVRDVIAVRRAHPVLRRSSFLTGENGGGPGSPDVVWHGPDGTPIDQHTWDDPDMRVLVAYLNGDGLPDRDPVTGRQVTDDSLLLVVNAGPDACDVVIPEITSGAEHRCLVSTGRIPEDAVAGTWTVDGRSLTLWAVHRREG